ncbi:MAG TPA: hypothetical protein VH000_06095, partial [Rhizomicrobium sp.]|nr:hypothetical protein [Rhizomicrobium sp.]
MLGTILKSIVHKGRVTLVRPGRAPKTAGAGEPHLTVRLHDRKAEWEMATRPELKLGELYMDGRLTVEGGDIADLLNLLMMNMGNGKLGWWVRLHHWRRRVLRPLSQFNPASRAKAHVAHHYDLAASLYDVFLDR